MTPSVTAGLCSALLIAALPVQAAPVHHCSAAPVRVSYERKVDADLVCDAAHRTIEFMTGHGFRVVQPLRVKVVNYLTSKPHLLGWFDPTLVEINILSFKDCASLVADDPPFGLPMGAAMHRSFIAHEIAHAVAQANFLISDPSVAAQEYIAYSVQLATMDGGLRQQLLSRYQLPPFADETEVTTLYLALDPASFAVKAYRHSTEVADAATFYRQLLSGEIRPKKLEEW